MKMEVGGSNPAGGWGVFFCVFVVVVAVVVVVKLQSMGILTPSVLARTKRRVAHTTESSLCYLLQFSLHGSTLRSASLRSEPLCVTPLRFDSLLTAIQYIHSAPLRSSPLRFVPIPYTIHTPQPPSPQGRFKVVGGPGPSLWWWWWGAPRINS